MYAQSSSHEKAPQIKSEKKKNTTASHCVQRAIVIWKMMMMIGDNKYISFRDVVCLSFVQRFKRRKRKKSRVPVHRQCVCVSARPCVFAPVWIFSYIYLNIKIQSNHIIHDDCDAIVNWKCSLYLLLLSSPPSSFNSKLNFLLYFLNKRIKIWFFVPFFYFVVVPVVFFVNHLFLLALFRSIYEAGKKCIFFFLSGMSERWTKDITTVETIHKNENTQWTTI